MPKNSSYSKQLEDLNGNPNLGLSEDEAEKIIFRFSAQPKKTGFCAQIGRIISNKNTSRGKL